MRVRPFCAVTPRPFASGVFALWLLLAGPAAACIVTPVRTVGVERLGGLLTVPLVVNGTPLRFIVDTGAARTVISEPAALAVKLTRDEWVSTDMQGVGGRERKRLGRPASLTLGGLALFRHTLASDNSVAVGSLPRSVGGQPIDGLLGQDFLSVYDLDIDPAAGTLTLNTVAGCTGSFLPWRFTYDAIPAIRVGTRLMLPVDIGGQELRALFDTGAQLTTLLASGVYKVGLIQGGLLALHGFGPGSQPARVQPIDNIHVGHDTIRRMNVFVTPAQVGAGLDMLVGLDWVGMRRAWVSWATDQVMVSTAIAGSSPFTGAPGSGIVADPHMQRIGP